jgi:hypothetical protein
MAKTGRPTKYKIKLGDLICTRISEGESLRSVCRDEDMPAIGTVCRWLLDEDKKEFREQYAIARDVQAEILFDETLEIADDSPDVIVGDDKSDNARVQAAKLRVETRKWYISKVLPKKFGDKLDLTSQGEKLLTGFEKLPDDELDREIERLQRAKDQARLRTGGAGKEKEPRSTKVRRAAPKATGGKRGAANA